MDKSISKELTVSSNKLSTMSQTQLEKYAEEKSKFILEKIELSTQKVAEAKEMAEDAQCMSTGWFGKTRRKAEATAEAVVATNEAMGEMNELLQESIRFTCLSMSFAQAMSKHMSALLVKGFETRDGDFIKLSDDSKEQAMYIIKQADDFAKQQLAVEMQQEEQKKKVTKLEDKIEENRSRLDEKDVLDKKQTEQINNLFDSLSEKDKIDEEQSRRLEELGALLDNKDILDQKQEEAISKNAESIKILFDYTKQKDILDKAQSQDIDELKKAKKINAIQIVTLVIAIIALGLSIFNLIV